VVLIVLGEEASRRELVTLLGFRVDWITVHQASFAVWATVTGLHLLFRIVAAVRLTVLADRRRPLPGLLGRLAVLTVALVAGVVLAVVLVRADESWHHDRFHRDQATSSSRGVLR
jgi:hypothetical protein